MFLIVFLFANEIEHSGSLVGSQVSQALCDVSSGEVLLEREVRELILTAFQHEQKQSAFFEGSGRIRRGRIPRDESWRDEDQTFPESLEAILSKSSKSSDLFTFVAVGFVLNLFQT